MKVLVIQHHSHSRRLVGHLLQQENVDVVECATMEEAVTPLSQQQIGAIFVEDSIPGERSRDAVRRIRSTDGYSEIPIVALIDREHRRSASDLIADGADDFLIVPAPLDQVLLRLRVILRWVSRVSSSSQIYGDADRGQAGVLRRLPEPALIVDRQGIIVDANEKLASLTGYSVSRMIAQPAELIGLPMAEEMPQLLDRVGSSEAEPYAITLVRRDMKTVATSVKTSWLDHSSKTMVICMFRSMVDSSIDQSPDREPCDSDVQEPEFLEFDRQGTLRTVTKPLAETLKTPREDLIGTSLRSLIHTDDLARISDLMAPKMHGRQALVTGNLRLRAGHDEWVTLRLSGSVPSTGERAERFRLEVVRSDFAGQFDEDIDPTQRDALTGLNDRQGLIEAIRRTIARPDSGGSGAVFFLTVDRFKMIQELYGYEIGDEILQRAALRLTELVPSGSVVARVGDYEFGMLAPAIGSEDDARALGNAIVRSFARQPIRVGEIERSLTLSIGVCLRCIDCADPAEMLRRADKASVNAMRSVDGHVAIYDQRQEEVAGNSLQLEQELLNAVRRNEFVVHYQPEVDLLTGAIVGVEALVRWNHPNGRILTPSKFIPTAEEAGIINQIGLWVLEESASDAVSWMSTLSLPRFTVSVNFSPLQFRQSSLVSEVMAVLRRTGLPPSMLRAEITESVLIDDQPELLRRIAQLRKLGASLALDDFGTGHASISSLRTLPVSYLKIDRSFVSGAVTASGELSLTRSIATLAQDSGLEVVVEGIETAEQLERIRKYGCRLGQGYFFSRAVDAETIRFLLSGGPTPFADLL